MYQEMEMNVSDKAIQDLAQKKTDRPEAINQLVQRITLFRCRVDSLIGIEGGTTPPRSLS